MAVRVVAAPPKDDVLDDDDGDEGGGPVRDEGEEVLEVQEEVGGGADGDGDHDGGHDEGEDVARHAHELRHEDLEVERHRVRRGRDVAEEREREDDDDELAEAAGGREHGREDAADGIRRVALLPGRDGRDGAPDGGAQDQQGNGREDEAGEAVEEKPPAYDDDDG